MNDLVSQSALNAITQDTYIGTTNCIGSPYTPLAYFPTASLTIEKLPGGFIVTAAGRREIVATVEALSAYLTRWYEGK